MRHEGFLIKIIFHCSKVPKNNNYHINSNGFFTVPRKPIINLILVYTILNVHITLKNNLRLKYSQTTDHYFKTKPPY